MVTPIDRVIFEGRSYRTLGAAFDAMSTKIEKPFEEFGDIVVKQLKRHVEAEVKALTKKHDYYRKGHKVGRKNMQIRSGRAVRELNSRQRTKRTDSNKYNFNITHDIFGPFYLNIHEDGGTIRPRKSKYLTVPLKAALDSRGVPIKKSAREWDNTFVSRTKNGNLIIFQKKGRREVVPLYVLKKEVYIRPRLGLEEKMDRGKRRLAKRVFDEVERRLKNA